MSCRHTIRIILDPPSVSSKSDVEVQAYPLKGGPNSNSPLPLCGRGVGGRVYRNKSTERLLDAHQGTVPERTAESLLPFMTHDIKERAMPKKRKTARFTSGELEILAMLWGRGPLTLAEAHRRFGGVFTAIPSRAGSERRFTLSSLRAGRT